MGTAIQNSQADTVKTVGRHFRLPGHEAHRDLVMLPIEIVSPRDPFLLRGRESYNIWKFQTEGFWILNMDSTWMRVNVEPLLLICGQKMCDSDSVKTNII